MLVQKAVVHSGLLKHASEKIMFSFWGELFFNKTPPHTY